MKNMNFVSIVLSLFLAVSLVGCGEDKPSDKVALDAIAPLARQNAPELTEVIELQRSNGEIVDAGAKIYKVTYSYKLRLTKPMGEVILAAAKSLEREYGKKGDSTDKGLFGSLEDMGNTLAISMAAGQWSAELTSDQKRERFQAMMKSSKALSDYIYANDDVKMRDARINIVLSAWLNLEQDYSFKDDFVAGSTVDRIYWQKFIKTEKGWQPVQS